MPLNQSAFRRTWLAAFITGLALAGPGTQAQTITEVRPPFIVADAATGEVLDHHDALRPWYPASTTKLMTLYLAFQAVEAGQLQMDSPVVVSAKALAQPPSKMGFKVGTELTLDDALKILMVKSANDVAVVVAEAIGGSVEGFARLMNAEALRLGMTRSNFVNPHGLPDPRQVSSARDLAVLARAILADFPERRDYLRVPAIQLGKSVMRNYNTLLDRYPGATGMKTGFICASGYNLVASAQRDGREVIAVVFGSRSGKARGEKAAGLLNAALDGTTQPPYRTTLDHVSSGSRYREPFDMRPITCPTREQAVAAADNPETDAASAAVQTAAAAPVLGPRFFIGAPEMIHPNIPKPGSRVAARPWPLPRARPPFTPALPGSDVAQAFAPIEPVTEAAEAVSSVFGKAPPHLPRPRPEPTL